MHASYPGGMVYRTCCPGPPGTEKKVKYWKRKSKKVMVREFEISWPDSKQLHVAKSLGFQEICHGSAGTGAGTGAGIWVQERANQ